MKCQTDFLLTVEASGLDWNLMVWDKVNFVFSSGSVIGDHGSGTVTAVPPQPGTPARAEIHGSMLYTGGPVNCKVILTVSYSGVFDTSQFALHVLQDGVEIVAVGDSSPGGTQPPSGTYNFTVGAGVASVIEVGGNLIPIPGIDYMALASNPGIPASVTFAFQLANV